MNNEDEALGLLARLPALLRWAGMKNFGSNLSVTYVAPRAQYVHHIDTQIFGERQQQEDTPPAEPVKDRTAAEKELHRRSCYVGGEGGKVE